MPAAKPHGLVLPLVTTAIRHQVRQDRSRRGLARPARTSPYQFYQFWINSDDRDIGRYLRYFTLLSRDEIAALDAETAANPGRREAQQTAGPRRDQPGPRRGRGAHRCRSVGHALPRRRRAHAVHARPGGAGRGDPVRRSAGAAESFDTLELFVAVRIAPSKGAIRRLLEQGGLSVNGRKLPATDRAIPATEALPGGYFLLRKGARDYALARIAG